MPRLPHTPAIASLAKSASSRSLMALRNSLLITAGLIGGIAENFSYRPWGAFPIDLNQCFHAVTFTGRKEQIRFQSMLPRIEIEVSSF